MDFHFISLVAGPGNHLFELDGNNDGPIDLGPIDDTSSMAFLRKAASHVRTNYISHFPNSHFSMMGLGPAATKK